jgi:RNA polymerase sigma factor (TIGR02999 family)
VDQPANATLLMNAAERGDPSATDKLLPLVYDELRRLAGQRLAHEPAGQTLQATALVHEAYLRLVGADAATIHWNSRRHFFAAAAIAMQRIMIERARRVGAVKHGGGRHRVQLEPELRVDEMTEEDATAVQAALEQLKTHDATLYELVLLRFFAGLSQKDTAQALGSSERQVQRDWAYAKAWLYDRLTAGGAP